MKRSVTVEQDRIDEIARDLVGREQHDALISAGFHAARIETGRSRRRGDWGRVDYHRPKHAGLKTSVSVDITFAEAARP